MCSASSKLRRKRSLTCGLITIRAILKRDPINPSDILMFCFCSFSWYFNGGRLFLTLNKHHIPINHSQLNTRLYCSPVAIQVTACLVTWPQLVATVVLVHGDRRPCRRTTTALCIHFIHSQSLQHLHNFEPTRRWPLDGMLTHAGHSIAWNVFALCDPVTLTFDLLT